MREGVLFKLEVQSLKVQMERLQWGFPIATALSLNKPYKKRKVIAKPIPILAKRKCPFPGGKRVGSWAKKEKEKESHLGKDDVATLRMGKKDT